MHTNAGHSIKIRGVDDVIAFVDSCSGIVGRAGFIWWIALGGLFLDALANSALGVSLGMMSRDLHLDAAEIAIMTSSSSWVAIVFNPIGGWMADRWGRVRPLVFAKVCSLVGAVLVMFAPDLSAVLIGRFFAGMAYGIDFAIAMALLAEYTPAHLKSRINAWAGMWGVAGCLNLLLALMFYSWHVGDAIWRYSIGATAVFSALILLLQVSFLVESPAWLARKERVADAAAAMTRIYGRSFVAAPFDERVPVTNQARRGFANVALIFRGIYLPRAILASTVQTAQAIEYFAIGWYLPVISITLFGTNFVHSTLGALAFSVIGTICGFLSPVVGRVLGLRRASAIGFLGVGATLLVLGLYGTVMPMWMSLLVPSLFLVFHSAGPSANGKSLSSLSFRSELRASANGLVGALGSVGAAVGLLVFPIFREHYGLKHTYLMLAAVPLLASIVCFAIKWDPTRSPVNPDNEPDAPQFKRDEEVVSGFLSPAMNDGQR